MDHEFIQKLQGLYQTRGGQIWASWHSLEDAWFVVKRNGSEIIRIEEQINSSIQAIQELGVEQHRNELLKDLNRRLHNFLASAITLVRYTDKHLNTLHPGSDLYRQFCERKGDAYQNEPVCILVEALRNVALHYGLPEIQISQTVEAPPERKMNDPGTAHTVVFSLDCLHAIALIKASGRKKQHKQAWHFLENEAGDLFPLTRMVDRFLKATEPIYVWLAEAENRVEKGEVDRFINEYNELVEKYNIALKGHSS